MGLSRKLKEIEMNRFKMVILVTILIFFETPAFAFFNKPQPKPAEAQQPKESEEVAKLTSEKSELIARCDKLQKDYEELKKDRDNILYQTKILIAEKNKYSDSADSIKKLEEDKKALEAEKGDTQKGVQGLEGKIKELENRQAQLIDENNYLKMAYKKMKLTSGKDWAKRAAYLEKENQLLNDKLKKSKLRVDEFSKQDSVQKAKIRDLEKRISELKKDNTEALKKNKRLEGEVKNIPSKFAEIARQNKALKRETSQMHYNLGVFYTKKMEYERAIAEFEKVLDIDPDDAYAHFNLGYIYAEYRVDRKKAIEQFRLFLRSAEGNDRDIDWVRKYLLTWETYEGKRPVD